MSEYQSYEFVALDQPLTAKQQAELRAISTRAEISSARFWNEYHYGDLKADPITLMEKYFDGYLYSANWGSRRFALRIPKNKIDVTALKPYFPRRYAQTLKTVGPHVLLDFWSDDEDGDFCDDDQPQASLAALSPVRTEILRGDLRPAYLAWLTAVMAGDVDDDTLEPPVPSGMATLTASQQALVEFLRIDEDLLAAAASQSRPKSPDNEKAFRKWVQDRPVSQKDTWLTQAIAKPDVPLEPEIRRAFEAEQKRRSSARARRTVREIRERASAIATMGERKAAELFAREFGLARNPTTAKKTPQRLSLPELLRTRSPR